MSYHDRRCGTRAGERYRVFDEITAALHLASYATGSDTSQDEQLAIGTRALHRMYTNGLPYVDGPRGREVDGDELLNFCRAVEDDLWKLGLQAEFRRLCGLYGPAMRRRERGEESRARLTLRQRRRWYFGDKAPGDPVRLSFDLPIDDNIRKTIGVHVLCDGGCRVAHSPEAVVMRGVVPADKLIEAEIRIDAVLDCETPQPAADKPTPDLSPWLALDEPGLSCTPHLGALAKEWTAGRTSGLEQIRGVWDQLERRVTPGFLHPDDDRIDPLDLGWGDCRTTSSLLVAMTRSLGIPARLVSGVLLLRDRPSDFHFWMEAWLPDAGWMPFDWLATAALCDGGDDESWRYHFFGRLDYRLVLGRLRSRFGSATGARLPDQWYRVESRVGTARVREYRARQDRRPVFTDTFEIEELSWI